MNIEQALQALKDAATFAKLPVKDQGFAASLLASAMKKAPSPKQTYWLVKMAEKATAPAPAAATAVDVDLTAVEALLAKAKAHLKFPKVLFRTEDGETLRLTVDGPTSKAPGSINITNTAPGFDRTWFGRVQSGEFQPSSKTSPVKAAQIAAALNALGANPTGAAGAYGKLTGNCCFCTRPLTDAASVAAGYGPVCAKHYGLPWGGEFTNMAEAA